MFVEYFTLIKNLFENVFKNGGSKVEFIDYLYILGYTFALIGVFVALLCICVGIIALPVFIHKKLLKENKIQLKGYFNYITKEIKDPIEVCTTTKKINKTEKIIKIKNIGFVSGVVFLYIPFIIPTVLFVISKVIELF